MYTNFTDMQFLYEDLFIIASFVALFGRTEPYPRLDSKAPPSSLLSVTQLTSVTIHLVLVVLFQVISLLLLWQNSWYKPHEPNYDHNLAGHDNYAIFAMSAFQCISLAVVFSKGKPYRKPIQSNYLFTGALMAITLATIVVLLLRPEWNIPLITLEIYNVTLEFRIFMVLLAFTHFSVAMFVEHYLIDHLLFKKGNKLLELFGIKPKRLMFEVFDQRTRSSMNWLTLPAKEQRIET